MDFLDLIVTAIISQIVEHTIAPVAHQLGYLLHYQRNLDDLENRIRELNNTKERVQHSVDDATRKSEEIEADVQAWLSRVGKIIEDVDDFLRNQGQATMRCSSGSFMNLASRRRISKKAKKLLKDVDAEIQGADKLGNVSFYLPVQNSIEIRGYETFCTRLRIFDGIKESLRDSNVRVIGLFGMAGVGKTMLAKEVARQAKQEMIFNKVIIATISQDPSLEKIQEELAEHLDLKLEEKTQSIRAQRLQMRLRLEKKILIILDDMWEQLALENIGICFDGGQMGCKVLITSRFRDLLRNGMSVDTNFHVEVLSDSEATHMFNKIVGDHAVANDEKCLATKIVEHCAGLPLAIATVANALKNKDSLAIWKNALQELVASNPINIKGMSEKVYSSIKLSYNFLGSEEEKSLLLLCSLYEEDANINTNYLARYCMGLGWFRGITQLDHARNKVLSLVENLKSSCLLLDGDYGGRAKMHDVVRDVMASIASEEWHMYNIREVTQLEDFPTKKRLESPRAISVLDKKNQWLPEMLECPQLEFLLVRNNKLSSRVFPHNFFKNGKRLLVLDLAFSVLEPLPSSFGVLENLRTLCLFHSKLGDISLLGKLKNLEILDLSWSNIEQLPEKIGQLSRLRLLDLRFCSKLEVIQPNIISRLTRLEELNMESSFTKWENEVTSLTRRNVSLDELKELRHLTTLNVCVLDVNMLPESLFTENLKRYKVLIGDTKLPKNKHDSSCCSRILKVNIEKANLLNKGGLKVLLERSKELYLHGLHDITNVTYDLQSGFPNLKHLEFAKNAKIKYIVEPMEKNSPSSAFQGLESLCLGELMNLEKICHGRLTEDSFGKLRVLRVSQCAGLQSIFSFSISQHLEEIEVIDCNIIKEVTTFEREDHNTAAIDKIQFRPLRSLRLGRLPGLIQFCSKSKIASVLERNHTSPSTESARPLFIPEVEFPCLEYMKLSAIKSDQKLWTDTLLNDLERDCFPQLKHLIVENIAEIQFIISTNNQQIQSCAFPSLESLHLDDLMKLEKICNAKLTPESFEKLKFVKVKNCDRLKNLWSFLAAHVPLQLEELELTGCNAMEEIVVCEGGENTTSEIQSSPLRLLRLISLPRLIQFFSESPKKQPGLANSSVPFFNGKVDFPKLEILEICSSNLQKLWDSSLHLLMNPTSFQNLTTLLVKQCGFLKNLFPSSVAANLISLRLIDVQDCEMMEEIICAKEGMKKIIFHKLNVLKLARLAKLTRFCTEIFIEFPQLTAISTKDCPELKTLIVESANRTSESFFNEKVSLPKLEKLRITGMDSLTRLWQCQKINEDSFCELKVVKINKCNNLDVVFPSQMLERIHNLRNLVMRECGKLEEVFKAQRPLNGATSLLNLKAAIFYGCHSLKSLFPLHIAKGLLQLEKLEVKNCRIQEIVSVDDGDVVHNVPRFVFPELTSLRLRMLPELLHFYPEPHTFEWPRLRRLKVCQCEKLSVFASELQSLLETSETHHPDIYFQS